jgi:glutamate/tyrosine decarboxylase-like PLP-dependent enzyme
MFKIPTKGPSKSELLNQMRHWMKDDANYKEGKIWSLVYYTGDELSTFLQKVYTERWNESSAANDLFPAIVELEKEVVSMAANLLNGDNNACGNITSGGTESILLAVKTTRDYWRVTKPHIKQAEIILPSTAHPAFFKAAEYFDVKPIMVSVDKNFSANIEEIKKAITPNTIMLIGSAPNYPQGVVDPIKEIAQLALERNLCCHVDACVGGFLLPFVKKAGYPVPDFDFSVPGVTSISADIHKYGYSARGASLVLYKNQDLYQHQAFSIDDKIFGKYISNTMLGTRPAGAIASAWSILHCLGEEGYVKKAIEVMQTVIKITSAVQSIPELKILGNPSASLLAIASDELDIYMLADELDLCGWHLERQQLPASLHLVITPAHTKASDQFIRDIYSAVQRTQKSQWRKIFTNVRAKITSTAINILPKKMVKKLNSASSPKENNSGKKQRSAPMYGMIGAVSNRENLQEFIIDFLDDVNRVEKLEDWKIGRLKD